MRLRLASARIFRFAIFLSGLPAASNYRVEARSGASSTFQGRPDAHDREVIWAGDCRAVVIGSLFDAHYDAALEGLRPTSISR